MPEDTTEVLEFEDSSALILDAAHTGSTNFILEIIDIHDDSSEGLINAIGEFDGRIITHVEPGKYVINITYDEDHRLKPVSISPDEIQSPPLSRTGKYLDIIPITINGPVRMEVSKSGDSNFHEHMGVSLYDSNGSKIDNLINDNEMEATDHAVTITTQGDMYISIEYYGSWSLTVAEI